MVKALLCNIDAFDTLTLKLDPDMTAFVGLDIINIILNSM